MCTCTHWCMWLAEVNAVSSPTAFYLIFIYFLNIYLFSAYVMGMHVPWHTRVRYASEDNFQELVLSFQLVGPKDRTQATIHTYSFKKYLFMCVRGSMCVLQCVDGCQGTTWVSWFSFQYEFQKSVSGYQVWQQVSLICWAILICLVPPTPWLRRIKLGSSCLQGKYFTNWAIFPDPVFFSQLTHWPPNLYFFHIQG